MILPGSDVEGRVEDGPVSARKKDAEPRGRRKASVREPAWLGEGEPRERQCALRSPQMRTASDDAASDSALRKWEWRRACAPGGA